MTDYYTADLHLGHDRVATLRGFRTTQQHDDTIINNLVTTTSPGDTIWVVGDVIGHSSSEDYALSTIMANVPDRTLHLIAGNHDPVHPNSSKSHKKMSDWLTVFDTVQSQAVAKLNSGRVIVSHFPYNGDHVRTDGTTDDRFQQWRVRDLGATIIHGHTHSTEKVSRSIVGTPQICVSVDAWGFHPVSKNDLNII